MSIKDEDLRADALRRYEVLNTPAEPNFDRITRIASSVLGRPVCTLALADRDRFWFKSKQGVDATEMPRELAFCEETIRGRDVFVVPDATVDRRFIDAPVVKAAPHVRFYAGAPLITPTGVAIGSLCVLDVKPEFNFSAESRCILADLAATSVELFEAKARHIELLKCTDEIAHLARHDSMTGLPNRRRFIEIYDEMARDHRKNCVALLYLDLDGFKAVNDTHGHSNGDDLLRQVAARIQTCMPPLARVARIGGDEFAVLLPSTDDNLAAEASVLARRLMTQIERPYIIGRNHVTIGCSIGIALSRPGSDLDDLLSRADVFLYQAKNTGRGRYLLEAV
jgi:diguanylate cyclase (GGDEF)-like protein